MIMQINKLTQRVNILKLYKFIPFLKQSQIAGERNIILELKTVEQIFKNKDTYYYNNRCKLHSIEI